MAAPNTAVIPMDLERLVADLRHDEQFSQFPYIDPLRRALVEKKLAGLGVTFDELLHLSNLTIGHGFNLVSDGIAEDESKIVLRLRAWKRYMELCKALPWVLTLDAARQGVLANMAYNLGVDGLCKFHVMLGEVRDGNPVGAADAMAKSLWAGEVGARATRLEQQMRTGVWL